MSRIAVVLLVAALLWMAPGPALGDEEQERSSRTPSAQGEEPEPCAAQSEATASGDSRYCPARGQAARRKALEAQEVPIYVPPQRGSPTARIGGSTRGGARPQRGT